ncbi:unnamed protein product, partial [Linum tenue]
IRCTSPPPIKQTKQQGSYLYPTFPLHFRHPPPAFPTPNTKAQKTAPEPFLSLFPLHSRFPCFLPIHREKAARYSVFWAELEMAMAARQLVCLLILAILGLSMISTEVMARGKNYGPGSVKSYRMRVAVQQEVRQHAVQERVHPVLQQVLPEVPLRPTGLLRQQAGLPLLQQLEDQRRRPQVPLSLNFPIY